MMTPIHMPVDDYRAYLLDLNDHIKRRFEFTAGNGDEALTFAQRYVDGHDVEV